MSTRSKNRHLELRLCPQHCTSCPVAHSRCLCVRLHVLFRQPEKLRSVEKPSSSLPVAPSSIPLGGAAGGRDTRFRLVNNPMVPFWFFSLFKCTFPSLQGFRPRRWHPTHHPLLPPPLPTPPQSCTAACATSIHWCRYKQRFWALILAAPREAGVEDIDARCQEPDAFSFQKYANGELRCVLSSDRVWDTADWFKGGCDCMVWAPVLLELGGGRRPLEMPSS